MALRSSLIFSWNTESSPTVSFQNNRTAPGLIQRCAGVQWISSEGTHQLHQRKAGAWNRKNNHLYQNNSTAKAYRATVIGLPMSTRASPVKHFVHGCHTVTAHGRNVTTSHNGVIHPRMYCQLLLQTESTSVREQPPSPHSCPAPRDDASSPWRTAFCPCLEDRTWGCSGTGLCSALCSLLLWQYHARALPKTADRDRHKWWRCNVLVSKRPFGPLLTLSTTPSRASWGLLFRRLAVFTVSGGQKGQHEDSLQLKTSAWILLLIGYLDRMLDRLPHSESWRFPHQRGLPQPGLDVTPCHRCSVSGWVDAHG